MTTVQELPVGQIIAGPNDRQVFSEDSLRELADSIEAHGLAQPITVRPLWLLPCGHVIAVRKELSEVWTCLDHRHLKLLLTQPDYLMEREASGGRKKTIDPCVLSRSQSPTMESNLSAGYEMFGELEMSTDNTSGSVKKNTIAGTGALQRLESLSFSCQLSCPTCGLSMMLLLKHSDGLDSLNPIGMSGVLMKIGFWEKIIGLPIENSLMPKSVIWLVGRHQPSEDGGTDLVFGSVEPITQIVAGERRYRAAKMLGWATIPCIVRDLDDEAAASLMLAENVARADLNPIEEARAYARRMEQFNWPVEKVSEIAGVGADTIRSRLSLLRLTPDIQNLVASGQMPLGHAEVMGELDNDRQRLAVRIFVRSGTRSVMSQMAFRELTSHLLEEQAQDALFDIETFWVQKIEDDEIDRNNPIWGKGAIINVPDGSHLPEVTVTNRNDTIGQILSRYVDDLVSADMLSEAAAVGKAYASLVTNRKVSRSLKVRR